MKIVQEGAIWILIMILVLAFPGTRIVSAGVPKTIKKYPIPDHGVLELSVPTS